MSEEPLPQIAVGRVDRSVVIRVRGAGTAAACMRLRPYLARFATPQTECLHFDLSETSRVDSTFVGYLVALSKDGRGSSRPAVRLVRPAAGVMKSLEQMYVLVLFDVGDALPGEPPTWHTVTEESADADGMADAVADAHEALIDADERNAPVFRRVVDLFRSRRGRPT